MVRHSLQWGIKYQNPKGDIVANENGNVKWYHLIWICGLITLALSGIITAVIGNDRLRACEDQRIEIKMDIQKDAFHSIDVRLARIEEKLGIFVK